MTAHSTLTRVRALIEEGETDLATIEAIRAVDSWWPEPGRDAQQLPALAEMLNVLGVLRHQVGDLRGAVGCFEAAVGFDPSHPDAGANLAEARPALSASDAAVPEIPTAAPGDLNPWTATTLTNIAAVVDLAGKDILEIGGAVPRAVVAGLGVARWVASELRCEEVIEPGYEIRQADAADLPFPDESFDAAFSACAFEHFMDIPGVLREAHRLLRPGGVLYSEYGPLWTHAHGHHLYTIIDGRLLSFSDPVVPNWAHLLLNRAQLRRFLSLGWGEEAAGIAERWIFDEGHANHAPEAEHRRAFWTSGFTVEALERGGWIIEPAPQLRAELEALHPDGSDFAAYTYRVVLRKPDAFDLRPGRERLTPRPADRALPSVSVVVPALAGSPFADAVASALQQTHPVHEVVVVHALFDDERAGMAKALADDDPRVRVLASSGEDPVTAVLDALGATSGDAVCVLHPFDVLLPHAVARHAMALADDPALVAAVGGVVALDDAGVPAPGARATSAWDRTTVIDGVALADAHLAADPAERRGLLGAVLRVDAVRAALPSAWSAPRTGALDALWCAVLAQGAVAALAEVVVGGGGAGPLGPRLDAREEWCVVSGARVLGLLEDPALDEYVTRRLLARLVSVAELRPEHLPALADLSARLQTLQGQAHPSDDGAPGAARAVVVLLEARHDVSEVWLSLEAVLGTVHADLVDLLLVDHSDGVLRPALEEVGQALAAQFHGGVRLVTATSDDIEAIAATVTNAFLAVVDDPGVLRTGWLQRLLGDARASGGMVVDEPGVTLLRRSAPPAPAMVPYVDDLAGGGVAGTIRVALPQPALPAATPAIAADPLVLVGRFRSGSTFFANLFRQDPASTVYLEPLHELLPELVSGEVLAAPGDFGHVGVQEYWAEYHRLPAAELEARWRPWFGSERWVLDAGDEADDLRAYLRWLTDRVPGRAVVKLVRADFRTGWLRANLPGATMVHLWREPREVWASTIERSPAPHQGFLRYGDQLLAAMGLPAMAHDYEAFYTLSLLSASAIERHADATWCHGDAVADFQGWSTTNLVATGLMGSIPDVDVACAAPRGLPSDAWFAQREARATEQLLAALPDRVTTDPRWLASLEHLVATGGRPAARPLPTRSTPDGS